VILPVRSRRIELFVSVSDHVISALGFSFVTVTERALTVGIRWWSWRDIVCNYCVLSVPEGSINQQGTPWDVGWPVKKGG